MKLCLSHNQWVRALNEEEFTTKKIMQLALNAGKQFSWHPLGFIVCKLSEEGKKKIRLHIWSSSHRRAQEPKWLIHDHSFDLRSWVLSRAIALKRY